MNEEQNNIVLSKTFSSIFNSVEEALWSFDFVKNTLEQLDITEPGNKRVAVTFRDNRRVHIDFCNWLIFGIVKKSNEELEVSIALMEEEMAGYNYKKQYFTMKNDEPQVCLVKMPLTDFRENDKWQDAVEKTLPIIKNKFKNHTKTPYLNSNNKVLEEVVFNTENRLSLLQSDLSVVPENERLDNIPSVSFDVPLDINDLFFEDKDQLMQQIHTALLNKKNIIFTGPPGTGKSKLAQQVCDSYQVDYHMTTATSDWSTYETIGGYMPNNDGTLQFKPGLFLDCFKEATTNKPLNKWLIIDEMNRADIDKAFGSLFSALTGDSIKLDFQSDSGESIILRPEKKNEKAPLNDFE